MPLKIVNQSVVVSPRVFRYFVRALAVLVLLNLVPLRLFDAQASGPSIILYDKCTALTFGMEGVPGELIVLRSFHIGYRRMYFTVNANTLKTSIVRAADLWTMEMPVRDMERYLPGSAYFRALHMAEENTKRMHNAGIIHVPAPEPGAVMSIDLCPTRRQMDRSILESIADAFSVHREPVPVSVALSGKWIEKHEDDLSWMKHYFKEKKIIPTWINHSYSHYYRKTEPLRNNFMMHPETDVRHEVFANEELMIENGIVPSVFFRFPGLTAGKKLTDEIMEYGLIPVGSDAWLAKKQQPVNGSIILVHANGRDPAGARKLRELLDGKAGAIQDGSWKLLDIKRCLNGTGAGPVR